jgi:hypothetical protein
MVAMPSQSQLHALPTLPHSLYILSTLYTYEKEKRDIDSIVFAQGVQFQSLPVLTLRSSILPDLAQRTYLPPMTASAGSCIAWSAGTLG